MDATVIASSEPFTLNRVFRAARVNAGLSVDYQWLSQLENHRLPISENDSAIKALVPQLAAIAQVDEEWLYSLELRYSEPPRGLQVFVKAARSLDHHV